MAYSCGICEENISRNQACLQCKICSLWFHSSCAKITDKELTFLKNNKALSYSCGDCVENPSPINEDIRTLNKKIDTYMSKGQEDLCSIKEAFTAAVEEIKADMNDCLKGMRTDITKCSEHIRHLEATSSARMSSIERENHILYKRLNRGDIVVRGLPCGLDDLIATVVALGAFYNIPVSGHDINHVCYISGKKNILVKFNNTLVRDKIMSEYFKTRNLRRGDIIDDVLASSVVGGDFGNKIESSLMTFILLLPVDLILLVVNC